MNKKWTPEQEKLIAVTPQGRPQLNNVAVRADAGSGKTSTLVERIKRILETAPNTRMICVSFTEKSAADLKDRLSDFPSCEVYTIHGFCMRVIKEFGSELGLPPIINILNQEKSDELFEASFIKVFKRDPLPQTVYSFHNYYQMVKNIQNHSLHWNYPFSIEWEGHDLRVLEKFAHSVFEEYEKAKNSINAIEFLDQEILCLKLLNMKMVSKILSSRYRYIFVDEFQDTNRIQCQIIEKICQQPDQLFVVGDEKQSIYRFRGSEVDVFNQFADKRKNQAYLTKNFRSTRQIIDTVNKICSPLIESYQNMVVGLEKTKISSSVVQIENTNDESILSAIRACLQQGHDLSDIVILLRRFSSIDKIINVLNRAKLPFATTSASQIRQDLVIRALSKMWRWAMEPYQNYNAAQVLAAFDQSVTDEKMKELLEFHKNEIKQMDHPMHILEKLNDHFQCKKKFGIKYEEFKIFINQEFHDGESMHEIAEKLDHLLEHESDIGNLVTSPPPPRQKGILRIMTVHAAKGLEFPAVILADLSFKMIYKEPFISRQFEKMVIRARDEEGELSKDWPPFVEMKEQELALELKESARLLYVAMTRAQESIVFVTDPMKKTQTLKNSETWNEWVKPYLPSPLNIPHEFQLQSSEEPNPDATMVTHGESIRIPEKNSEKILDKIYLYSKARVGVTEYLNQNKVIQKPDEKNPKTPQSREQNFSELGTRVHELLQFSHLSELWKYCGEKKIPIQKFKRWFESDPNARLIFDFQSYKKIFNEFSFETKVEDKVLTGRIDRLIQNEDEILVVDFKTVFKKTTYAEFVNEYSKQLNLYENAIKGLFLAKKPIFRKILIDLTCATGQIFHEIS